APRRILVDFGLAKPIAQARPVAEMATARPTEDALTSPGVAMGTVAYMTPEQARREELDARTDLFQLRGGALRDGDGKQAFAGTSAAPVFNGSTPPYLAEPGTCIVSLDPGELSGDVRNW